MALPAPTPSTITTNNTWEGLGDSDDQRHPQREHQLLDRQHDQEPLAIHLVRQQAAEHGQDESRAELGEDDDADERARVGQVVGVGAEYDVLHPRPDVRGERPEEDDAERAVAEGRPGRPGAGRNRRVAVDNGVFDLLYGDRPAEPAGPDPGRVTLSWISGHGPMVRERRLAGHPPRHSAGRHSAVRSTDQRPRLDRAVQRGEPDRVCPRRRPGSEPSFASSGPKERRPVVTQASDRLCGHRNRPLGGPPWDSPPDPSWRSTPMMGATSSPARSARQMSVRRSRSHGPSIRCDGQDCDGNCRARRGSAGPWSRL